MRPFADRRVVLVVSGGISAYKTPYLVRRLQEAGAELEVVLTSSAERFVGRTTFEGITGRAAHTSLWDRPLAHVELGREADAVVVAPATADLLARMAAGRADDLAAALLLAAAAPTIVCPAMNQRMWTDPSTRRNVARLEEAGVVFVGPEHGELAEGEVGPGRMSEPEVILAEVGRVLEATSPLEGREVVVTAGPTRAWVDPVRFLTSASSGRMGHALAASAWRRGAEVTLISGPGAHPPPHGPRLIRVEEADGMLQALRAELPGTDVLLMAAAVADYRLPEVRSEKIKKEEGELRLEFVPGPDLLSETSEMRSREGILTVGFALETEAGRENARRKLQEKEMDFVALNEPGGEGGPGGALNRVLLLDRDGEETEIPLLPKEEVADRILDRVEARLEERDG